MKVTVLLVVRAVMGVLDSSTNVSPLDMHPVARRSGPRRLRSSAIKKFSSDALQRRDTLAWSSLAGEHQSCGRVHTVDHRRRDQDRGAAFLCRLVDDVHDTQLQGGWMIGINLGSLDKLPRDLGFGRPENDAGLFLALGLGLARHGILPGHWDSDVADLHRGHR